MNVHRGQRRDLKNWVRSNKYAVTFIPPDALKVEVVQAQDISEPHDEQRQHKLPAAESTHGKIVDALGSTGKMYQPHRIAVSLATG